MNAAPPRSRILFVTDLAYEAKGRRYCDEDIYLTARLREDFDVALCHPLDAASLMETSAFDAVMVRNSGPVLNYQADWDDFRARAARCGARVYNQLTGRADMLGKQYLLDLTAAGYPVIPTVDDPRQADRLPEAATYAVKPKQGADSIGLEFLPREALAALTPAAASGILIQPRIDFTYEVSFYFVDRAFQYALYAPDPERRWHLERYAPTPEDLAFAQRFVDWNTIDHGIQRVDACRTPSGGLLLVELEDLNPYLSLDLLDEETRDAFVAAVKAGLRAQPAAAISPAA
ncbi:hypothetical protein [Streptomyces alboniger]|uniref:ATP-grasp domain-containing protein n=1 Tax=Streptomyces alboniger TaxID=132473 RepID=A0A5J6HGG5_STRAD|nr:hypothetical protein [Streptomyces alboniger]QEV18638.1 hypothetical protein CP975_15080 [Streptomyces alboniger]